MNMIHKIVFAAILAFLINNTGCERSNEVTGTVKDFTGLDGCKLLIVLDDGQKLEPQVLPQGTILVAEKKVAITYKPLTDRMSICMAGPVVEILTLRYLKP